MIKILIVSLITLFTTQAFTGEEQNICEAIKTKVLQQVPPYTICQEIVQTNHQYDAQIFSSTCDAVMMRLASDVSDDNVTWCKEQFKPVTNTEATEGDELVKVPVDATAPIPDEPATTASIAMDQCQEDDLSNFSCTLKTSIILPDFNSIMSSPVFAPSGVSRRTPAVYTPEKCNCFEKSVNKSFTLAKKVKFDMDLKEQKKRVNDLIFNAAGKKIINAFAANIEDINFYKTNNVQAIGGDQSANELQCTSMPDFKQVIMEACNKNKIAADVIKGRTESLLGAFGDFKDQKTIGEKFKQLQEEVLNAQLDPSKIVPGGPKSYSRRDYDKARFGIYQKRDEVRFMSELTDAVMNDPALSKIVEQDLEAGKRPGHAIFKLVSDESNEKVNRILSRIVRNHNNQGFYKNLGVALKTPNPDDLHSLMMSTYDLAADMHPGLKAVFRSPDLFRKTRAQMKKNDGHDLIAQLDRDPELLKTFFKNRCDGIKAQFAEALCYREENLTDLANKEDLNKLLSSVSEQISPIMKDAILCRMPDNSRRSNSVFSKLAFNMGDKLTMADYFKRKVNATGGPSSRFERFAMEFTGGGSNSKYLAEMSDFGSELRKPSAEFAAFDKASTTPQSAENKSIVAPVPTQEKTTELPQRNQTFANNYAAPIAPLASDKDVASSSREQKDPRSLLRDFLADEENKSEVDRHLSNLNSKDQEELARLKEEIAADKEKILALLQESERLKLKGYEQKVTEAEAQLVQPQVQAKSNNTRKNFNEAEDYYSSSSGTIASSTASTPVKDVTAASSASSTSTSSGSTASVSSGTQRSLASLNSSLSAATNNVGSSSSGASSNKSEIIIQSSGSSDVSKEVISYLKKNEPDVETLKQLKNKGMTFKFKIVENGKAVEKELKVNYASLSKEAKQFLDQKIAVQEAKRNYSYNVLRLMLGLKAQKQL